MSASICGWIPTVLMSWPFGREVARGRDLHGRAVTQREDRLHDAFAVRLRPDQRPDAAVLDRAGGDLRGRGRIGVHQHRQRARGDGGVLGVVLGALAGPRLHRHDRSGRDELRAHVDRRVEVAAAVVAQVEHVGLCALRFEPVERGVQFGAGVLTEHRELRVADVAGQQLREDAGRLDRFARDRDRGRSSRRCAGSPNVTLRPRIAAQQLLDARSAATSSGAPSDDVFHRPAVDRADLVVGANPGPSDGPSMITFSTRMFFVWSSIE